MKRRNPEHSSSLPSDSMKNHAEIQSEKDLWTLLESVPELEPGDAWQTELFLRLNQTNKTPGLSGSLKYAAVLAFFLLINLGFALKLVERDQADSSGRYSDLQAISSEFLINPGSVKN